MTDETPDDAPDFAERALLRRKREDTAFAVPAVGVLLLCSPLLNIWTGPLTVFGLPAAYAYVFLVWFGLILVTRSLARRLSGPPEEPR